MKQRSFWFATLITLILIVAGTTIIIALESTTSVNQISSGRDISGGETGQVVHPLPSSGTPAGDDYGPVALIIREPEILNSTYRTITDMSGRSVIIPKNITLVLCTSPPPRTFVYMLAPEKLGNVPSSITDSTTKTTVDNLSAAQANTSISGQGQISYEAYIAMHPDLVFISCESGISDPTSAELTQEKFGSIPVVCVNNARNATMYGPTLLFMGDILGVPEVAEKENAYYQSVLTEVQTKVATIPEEKRVRVYYAEDTNGLSTEGSGSCHSQLIDVCGGINVAGSNATFSSEKTGVTKESILMWKPDVILSSSKDFIAMANNDSTWQMTPAVRNHRVYLIPVRPNNWFDRPPGVNRIVGIPWTAHVLYPDLFTEDWFSTKAKEFYSRFYHIDLSDQDLADVLSQKYTDRI